MYFVSPVATILNTEQMFISIEMALIPFQLCEYFFLGAKRSVRAQQAGVVAAASEKGNKLERQVGEQHKAS